jgi:uncharacterized protein (DUF362 family)/Pyruvate/2-oxoacid:ferredoxin oxidoreductase delta subunit
MPRVILRYSDYTYENLRKEFFQILDSLNQGGIRQGSKVLIKPNLLAPAAPDKAMLTHPLVVRAAVEYVLESGGFPQVSDSPATGSFEKIIEESGLSKALEGLAVEFREFKRSATVDVGPPFNRIEIAEDALKADMVINLPKLKTHSQMLLTLGVKNLFGCIVGLRKPEWHLRTGIDREMFARLLVKVYETIRPGITVIDGILAMEGDGPGKGGTPRDLGLLMGSDDALALDGVVCRVLGIEPDSLLTFRVASDMGFALDDPEVDGDFRVIEGFKLPEITPLIFGPKPLHGLMRRHLVQRPVVDDSLCRLCGECWKYCPAAAITGKKRKLQFDYEKCIRCYCCIEVCPQGALAAKETVIGKVLRSVINRRSGSPS